MERKTRIRIIHYCNQFIDRATCCPVAHGAPENQCNKSRCFEIVEEQCDMGQWHQIKSVEDGHFVDPNVY